MAAAAPALPRVTQEERNERQEKMREFFRKLTDSERERWIQLIEMQRAAQVK